MRNSNFKKIAGWEIKELKYACNPSKARRFIRTYYNRKIRRYSNKIKKIFGIKIAIMLMITGCVKTIQVKTDTTSNLEYIEPQQCQIRTIDKMKYKTTIQGDSIVISNQDMGAFLNNILDYKQAVNEYQQCVSANEEYYKNIINSILK